MGKRGKKTNSAGCGCGCGIIFSLIAGLIQLVISILASLVNTVVSVIRYLGAQKVVLPIGSGFSTSLLGILVMSCILCFGCSMVYAITDATLREVGVLPTYTPRPTRTPTLTPSPLPTHTETPTITPTPTSTPIPTPTPTVKPCLNAAYVADVTVPDGSRFENDVSFVKTWRVKNNGQCDWDEGIIFAFVSGDKMGAPDAVTVGIVKVGQQVEVSVQMRSPVLPGKYKGIWRMRDAHGNFFGEQLTVVIVAGNPTPVPTPQPPIRVPTVSPSTRQPAVTPVRVPTVPPPPPAPSYCCKHCGPNSQPCGNSCISLGKTCRQPPGCACW